MHWSVSSPNGITFASIGLVFMTEGVAINHSFFLYIYNMKAIVIQPKNSSEYRFIADLLKKLGVGSSSISTEELEDIGMSKLLRDTDKSKKVTRASIMKKLSA
jgi:hypothetical protein